MFGYSEQPADTRSEYVRSISVRYNGKFIGRVSQKYDSKQWRAMLRLAWSGCTFATFEEAKTALEEAYLKLRSTEVE
jgi:hypothetical protein